MHKYLIMYLLPCQACGSGFCFTVDTSVPFALPGVRWRFKGKWVAEIRGVGEKVWLGSFDSPEEAARVYDFAAV